MTVSRFRKLTKGFPRLLAVAVLLMMQAGCATYYSHYAMFPAENSQGEPRTVRVSWQSAEYPDWWFASDQATPITLETQCSERVWQLHDDSHAEAGNCSSGIRACGEEQRDRLAAAGRAASSDDVCMAVNAIDPQAQIASVPGRLELLVACEPASVTRGEGKDAVNVDYIRPSTVPYTVYTRKTLRGSLNARPPKFDRTVCETD